MAAWQKEGGLIIGRGFDAGGFLGKLKAWIVKIPTNGGPGWYIVDDQSALGTNPYIVVSDVNFPYANANKHKIVVFGLPTASAGFVNINCYHFHDTTGHVSSGEWARYQLRTVDAGQFSYDFRGGPEGLCISSRNGSTIDNFIIDEWTGPDDTIVLEPTTKTGTLSANSRVETGDNNNQVSNYDLLTGVGPNLDAVGKLYFSVVVSGSNSIINIYKDSARLQLIGHTANAATIGSVAVTADNSSGLGGNIRRDAVVANDVDIEVDFSLVLGAGEGANFTVGNYYFFYDFAASGIRLIYFKVRFINTDSLVPDYIGAASTPLNAGAVVAAYPHRFACLGNYHPSFGTIPWGFLPYYSVPGGEYAALAGGIGSSGPRAAFIGNGGIAISNPDDLGYYRATELLIYESANGNSPSGTRNRIYGTFKNVYLGSNTAMQVFTDGRTLDNGLDYFDISHQAILSGNEAWLIRDTTSTS